MKTISKWWYSVCDLYRMLKNDITWCWKISIEDLLFLEKEMPYKRLKKILDNRDKYFKMYPEEKEKIIEWLKKDWVI